MILHFYTCFSTCSFIIRLRGSGKLVRIDRNMRLMIHNRVYSGVCPCCFQNLFHASQRSTDPLHLLPSSPMLVVSHGFPYQNAERFSAPKGAEMCVMRALSSSFCSRRRDASVWRWEAKTAWKDRKGGRCEGFIGGTPNYWSISNVL